MADAPVLAGAVGWTLEPVGAVGAGGLAAGREREGRGTHLYQGDCDPLWEEMNLSETYSGSKPAVLSIRDNQNSLL